MLSLTAMFAAACAASEDTVIDAAGSGGGGGASGSGGSSSARGGASGGGSGGAGGSSLGGSADSGHGGTGGMMGTAGAAGTALGGSGGRGGEGATGGAGGRAGGSGGRAGTDGSAGAAGTNAGGTGGGAGTGPGTGGSGIGGQTCGGGSAMTGDVTVNLSSVQQKISGFGVSTAWGSSMSTSDAALLWSTTTGAGLSLHRVRIDYTNGHTSELNIAKMAVGYGVTVWATPWTPPVADKSNNNSVEGTLTNPSAYATFLVGFVNWMKQNGVDIYAISAQNEPDANVTYESCVYTGATMASWVGGYLGPAFAGTGVKVMAPETQNWCGFQTFEPALMADANAKKYTDIVATHEYGCNPKAYPDIAAAGKEFWETEIYDSPKSGDNSMSSPLRMAKLIHDAMTIANMNAWHYWWVYDSNTGLFTSGGNPTKRLYVEGQYARFVRPGFVRVGMTGTVPSGLLVTAYTNQADGTVAIVAINNNTSTTPLSLYISGPAPCSVTPWVTSTSDSLASKTAVSVSGGRVSVMLAAQSVTTLVGKP
jgi:glucuronoarabinoxylan endo-1,4-beta-xylanase